jgi:hypothetical protein
LDTWLVLLEYREFDDKALDLGEGRAGVGGVACIRPAGTVGLSHSLGLEEVPELGRNGFFALGEVLLFLMDWEGMNSGQREEREEDDVEETHVEDVAGVWKGLWLFAEGVWGPSELDGRLEGWMEKEGGLYNHDYPIQCLAVHDDMHEE